jgi:hypothetical protein
MKKGASALSEMRPMQAAHVTRDGVLFQPLSAGIPPWAESGDKLCATQFHATCPESGLFGHVARVPLSVSDLAIYRQLTAIVLALTSV